MNVFTKSAQAAKPFAEFATISLDFKLLVLIALIWPLQIEPWLEIVSLMDLLYPHLLE